MVTASGVSSTMTSTPVACSNERMLRPLRPTMRPFISSLGRLTIDVVTSATLSDATRWIASAMSSRAFSSPVSRASFSIWRMMRAISLRAVRSTSSSRMSRASSVVSSATRCNSFRRSLYKLSISLARLSMLLWRLLSELSRCCIWSKRRSSSSRRFTRRSSSLLSSLRRCCSSFSAWRVIFRASSLASS